MKQMLEFLPERIKRALSYVNQNFLYELRLRAEKPIRINYNGKYEYLGEYGIVKGANGAIVVHEDEIAETVYVAGKYSIYSVEEQLRRGYITAEHGERIGLAGEFVFEKGQALTTKNFSSLCIRVPHEIYGCGKEIYQKCFENGLKNLLISSPPGQGKTTVLRDLARLISANTKKNLLICDERGEIAVGNYGETVDAYLYADKQTAFEAGIRAMRPDVILCDELSAEECSAVKRAINGGVKVIASAHLDGIDKVKEPYLGLFERYAFLSTTEIGKLMGVFDNHLRRI